MTNAYHSSQRTSNAAVMRTPISHHESLKAKLILEQMIKRIAVLTSIAIIDQIVRTHHRACARSNSIGKRPEIQLVHGLVVDVRAEWLTDREVVACCFGDLTEVFLLVADVVLRACDYTCVLNTLYRFADGDAREVGVGTEAYDDLSSSSD